MKESITKFDLESAFKALDEIEIPKADKVRANKPALTEIFSCKSKFDIVAFTRLMIAVQSFLNSSTVS